MVYARQIGEIDLLRSSIESGEGLFSESLRSQMSAHKLIKSPYLWESSILETFGILVELEKFADAETFLDRLLATMQECLKNKEFEDGHMKIGSCLAAVHICRAELVLSRLEKGFDKNEFKVLLSSLKNFTQLAAKYGTNLNHALYITKLMGYCEAQVSKRSIVDETSFKECYKLANVFIKMGHRMDTLIKANLKYVYGPELEARIRSPLITFHNRLKLSLARLYVIFGDLGSKATGMSISLKRVEVVEGEDEGLEVEDGDIGASDPYKDMPEVHVKYLKQLVREIELQEMKVKKRYDNFEKALDLAKEVENTSFLEFDKSAAKVEAFRALRRKNKKVGNLVYEYSKLDEANSGGISTEEIIEPIPEEERETYKREMMQKLLDVKEALRDVSLPIQDYCRSNDVFRTLKRVHLEELEILTGTEGEPEDTIAALIKFQDYQSLDYLAQVTSKHSRKTSRPHLLRGILKSMFENFNYTDTSVLEDLKSNYR